MVVLVQLVLLVRMEFKTKVKQELTAVVHVRLAQHALMEFKTETRLVLIVVDLAPLVAAADAAT